MSKFNNFIELKPYYIFLKKYWLFEFLMLIILGTACSLAMPYVLGKVIDIVIPSSNKDLLIKLILIIIFINLIRSFVGWSSDYLNTWLSGRIITDIKSCLFSNLLYMPYEFFEKNKTGEIIQVVSDEVDKIQHFLTSSIIRFLNNGFTIVSLISMLCYLNYKLFFITLIVLPPVIYLNIIISRKVRGYVMDTGIQEGNLNNFYFERIRNISTVKLFNTYIAEYESFVGKLRGLFSLYLKNSIMTGIGNNVSFFLISLSPLLILLTGGFHVMDGIMSIGALVSFIQYSNRLIAPTNDFLGLYIDFIKAHESAKRISPYINADFGADLDQNLTNESFAVEKLKCVNLSFRTSDKLIINNVNFEFTKGSFYGILGLNGAGKSTLGKLLSQLYKPSSGFIEINDNDILDKLNESIWSKHIVVISQHSAVFNESIRDNLKYADSNANDEKLWDSLEKVGLRDYINSLPLKLSTLIGDGENSANPSGGQLQRLALARIFLKSDAQVILLDEACSAMDKISIGKILLNIRTTFPDRIIISITHNLEDTSLFDYLLFMEEGTLVEYGKPGELLANNGKYAGLFKIQKEKILKIDSLKL